MSRENLEEVLNALLPFAKTEFQRTGSVTPIAGSLDDEGGIEFHLPRTGHSSTTEELIHLLQTVLRHGARDGSYQATGLLMKVRAQRPGSETEVDAIAVHLEAAGESLMAFLPYSKDADGEIVYADVFFGPADPHAFSDNDIE